MAIKQLTDDQALALSGATDARTGLVYPILGRENWGEEVYRALNQFLVVTIPDLRVVQIQESAAAVGVLAGSCSIAGVAYEYAGATGSLGAVSTLPANGTRYIWAYVSNNAIAIGSGSSLPTQAATPHIPLARVTRADSVITALVDLRGQTMLRQIRQAVAVANLSQSISNPPTQAEVTAIQTKVNDLLNALRTAGLIATS